MSHVVGFQACEVEMNKLVYEWVVLASVGELLDEQKCETVLEWRRVEERVNEERFDEQRGRVRAQAINKCRD